MSLCVFVCVLYQYMKITHEKSLKMDISEFLFNFFQFFFISFILGVI